MCLDKRRLRPLAARMSDDADNRDSLVDDAELETAREIFYDLFKHLSLSDAIELSGEGTAELDLYRAGYTYGETSLQSILRLLRAASPHSYPGGASIVDLGSGIGNVVVGTALLAAAALVHASSVRGVELLPPLHRTASSVLDAMKRKFRDADAAGCSLLAMALPECALRCADLADADVSDADIVYMCSTAFPPELVQRWAVHAAPQLRSGSRVVTLSRPLRHERFELERIELSCGLSWGNEHAYVSRKLSSAWERGGGRLLTKGAAPDGRRTEWTFVGQVAAPA